MLALRLVTMALVIGVFGGSNLPAADGPLAAFPKDTGVIVRLKNPQKTLQTAGELAVKVDRKEGVKVQLAGPMLGMAISNPSLKGVDMASDWWLGVFPQETGEPGVVFCIPATDAKAFQESVMGNYQFQTLEKHLIYTEHEASAAKIKEHIASKGTSISTLLDETSTAIWDEGDLSVFINVPQILKVYQGPFDQGVEKANQFIEQMPNLIPQQQTGGVDMKAIADMYAGMFKGLVQAVRDAEGCTAGLAITADGISVGEYVKFGDASETVKALSGQKPSNLELLNQLPKGRLGYGAAEFDTSALMKWGMEFSLKMATEGDTEKENQMKKLMADYGKVKFQGMAVAFGLGDAKQGAIRATSVVKVDQAEKLRALSLETSKLMKEANFGGMKMKMTFQPEAETYGNLKADIVRAKYEVDPNQDPLQIQSKMNEIFYGPEGMVTRTLYMQDRMVQTIGGDKADVEAALDAQTGKNAVGKEAAYQATRKKLLPQANFIGLLDLPGTLASGMELAIQAGAPIPLNENDVKEVRGETSFLGFSVGMEKSGLKAKTVVPVEQMQGVARFVRKIEAARQQQQ